MDVSARSVFLPIEIWLANAELVHEDFEVDGGEVTKPRIQNLKDIEDNGYALGQYLDDETNLFNEPKEIIEVPNLTAVGPKVRDVKILSGAEEVTIPINALNYALYAILQGLDPDTSILNDADIRFDNDGYTDDDGSATANETFDKIATILDRQETIDTITFCLLAQVQPADPTLGDRYVLLPKLAVNVEEIQQTLQSEYFSHEVMLKSVMLTNDELTRWQNILPAMKKTIGLYSFHIDEPET